MDRTLNASCCPIDVVLQIVLLAGEAVGRRFGGGQRYMLSTALKVKSSLAKRPGGHLRFDCDSSCTFAVAPSRLVLTPYPTLNSIVPLDAETPR